MLGIPANAPSMQNLSAFILTLAGGLVSTVAWSQQGQCPSGYRTDGTCASVQAYDETPVQAMLRWDPGTWKSATRHCSSNTRGYREFGAVPCSTISAMEALCQSTNAGERARQQCARWGFAATDWSSVVLGASRELALKVYEMPWVNRWGITEAFVDVAANEVLKAFVGKKLGEGCANQLDAVARSFTPPKSGLGAYAASLDLAKPMAEAIVGFTAAKVAWEDNQCRMVPLKGGPGDSLVTPELLAYCRNSQTNTASLKFAQIVVDTLISEYSCKAFAR